MTIRHALKVEPSPAASVASRIGALAGVEGRRAAERSCRKAAVQDGGGLADAPHDVFNMGERVPVFGEDDDRLPDRFSRRESAVSFVSRDGGGLRRAGERSQKLPFECAVTQGHGRPPCRRFVGGVEFAHVVER